MASEALTAAAVETIARSGGLVAGRAGGWAHSGNHQLVRPIGAVADPQLSLRLGVAVEVLIDMRLAVPPPEGACRLPCDVPWGRLCYRGRKSRPVTIAVPTGASSP